MIIYEVELGNGKIIACEEITDARAYVVEAIQNGRTYVFIEAREVTEEEFKTIFER